MFESLTGTATATATACVCLFESERARERAYVMYYVCELLWYLCIFNIYIYSK